MKFVLFVEGQTEQACLPAFLKRWLDSRLDSNVGIQAVRFEGWGEFQKKAPRKAQFYLDKERSPQRQVIAVIGLLDLYGPKYPEGMDSPEERYRWLVKHFEDRVDRQRFRMFCAVHELEAWILSQPGNLPPKVAKQLPGQASSKPESVNFNEPPSKLLNRLYRKTLQKGYKKITYGKELFAKLEPSVVEAKCPHFKDMLDKMLELAEGMGL